METNFGTIVAGGGVSSAIMAGLYIAYKCCYRRKFHSKCCGASMDIDAGEPSPTGAAHPTIINVQPSPALKAEEPPKMEMPQLELSEHVRH